MARFVPAVVSNNWKTIAFGAISVGLGVASFLYPPAALAKLGFWLANLPGVSALGAYAATVASGVVATAVAGATYGACRLAGTAFGWLQRGWNAAATRFSKKASTNSTQDKQENSDDEFDSTVTAKPAPLPLSTVDASQRPVRDERAVRASQAGTFRMPSTQQPQHAATADADRTSTLGMAQS
ncbi:Uncharacterised protein (plasmid) [Legionella adelaidensis]|uniref:Transmembrane protein n=1 Tax=Legionella adelaidensis TaxID=45056 RepID=A0A0W0R1D4_9GAMM|nr:hypothetical protein [Legionella adelaidensis]KTC64842.1 hypothetical protein Lade_2136 [Legionella adelaidensis]VEH82987.1 Uncharacterised protein [Legionella adelaidensis]